MRYINMALILVLVVGGLFLLIYEPKKDRTLELACRNASKIRQEVVFDAIKHYYLSNDLVPTNLTMLVDDGLVEYETLLAPKLKTSDEPRLFLFYSENFGDPTKIVLSDIRRESAYPSIINTYGDGKVIVLEVP